MTFFLQSLMLFTDEQGFNCDIISNLHNLLWADLNPQRVIRRDTTTIYNNVSVDINAGTASPATQDTGPDRAVCR